MSCPNRLEERGVASGYVARIDAAIRSGVMPPVIVVMPQPAVHMSAMVIERHELAEVDSFYAVEWEGRDRGVRSS